MHRSWISYWCGLLKCANFQALKFAILNAFTSKSGLQNFNTQRDISITIAIFQKHIDLFIRKRSAWAANFPQALFKISLDEKFSYKCQFVQTLSFNMSPTDKLAQFQLAQNSPNVAKESNVSKSSRLAEFEWVKSSKSASDPYRG